MAVMKSRWVFDFKLGPDGSILKVKCRFVGCGYSQVEGRDYDKTYAATLPGCAHRSYAQLDLLQLIVAVHLIGTKFMCADIFTKATDESTFKTMRSVIRNESSTDGYALRAVRWINTLMHVASPVSPNPLRY